MAKIMHTCVACGNLYEACDYCDKHSDYAQGWRRIACSPEHYQAYLLYVEWREGRIDTETAAIQIDDLGIDSIGRLNVREIMQAKNEKTEDATKAEAGDADKDVFAQAPASTKKRSSKR